MSLSMPQGGNVNEEQTKQKGTAMTLPRHGCPSVVMATVAGSVSALIVVLALPAIRVL